MLPCPLCNIAVFGLRQEVNLQPESMPRFTESTNSPEPVILFKPTRLYRPGMPGTALYDITRGVWRLNRERAERATLGCAVINGAIIEVYAITAWHDANTTPYLSGRRDQAHPQFADRLEFTGRPAASELRDRYVGRQVGHLFGRGQVVAYLDC